MPVKAIVLDIDGTLLSTSREIGRKTKSALLEAQGKGLKVILASGRPTSGMRLYEEELQLAEYGGYLVSYNGAMVTECKTGKVVFNQVITVENCREILTHLKQFDVIPMINDEKYMYVNDVYNNMLDLEDIGPFNIIQYESRGGNFKLVEEWDLPSFLSFPLNKILVAGQPEYLKKYAEAIYAPFKDRVTGAFSAPFYFEFTDKHIDKAKALSAVLTDQGILGEHLIAFGDGQNDRSIIEYAGIGVAMGNAVAELKEIANHVTATNDEDGIALALAKFLG